MITLLVTITGALFSIMNPLGTVPIFVGLTQNKAKTEIHGVALWTSVNILIILLICFFLGSYLLNFFGISLPSLRIAGGLIIASSGFALLTGQFSKHKGMKEREKDDTFSRNDIALTPLAIPMLAGPGTISLLISLNKEYQKLTDIIIICLSIILVTLIIFIILKFAHQITKFLGASGINALSRIIGFIIISIGVELILSTTLNFIQK